MKQTKKGRKSNSSNDSSVMCIHCHNKIVIARLIGISLICPFCGKPSDRLFDKHIIQ